MEEKRKCFNHCPICGKRVWREAFVEVFGRQSIACECCGAILSIPGDLKKEITFETVQVADGPLRPMGIKEAFLCPKCGALVIRKKRKRLGFCESGTCNTLLVVSSKTRLYEKIIIVPNRNEDGVTVGEMTRTGFRDICSAVASAIEHHC